MARAKARSIVAVKIFVEEQMVTPVRVGLKLLLPAVHRPSAIVISQKNTREAAQRCRELVVQLLRTVVHHEQEERSQDERQD